MCGAKMSGTKMVHSLETHKMKYSMQKRPGPNYVLPSSNTQSEIFVAETSEVKMPNLH